MGMIVTRLRMRVPDLRVQADVAQIKQILSSAPGIDQVIVDYEAGILEFTTAAQDGGADTLRMLAGGGYPPSEVEHIHSGNHPG